MSNMIIDISSVTELQAALKTATGGETFALGDTEFGALTLSKLSFDTAVTLTGGHFSSLAVLGVHGIKMDGAQIDFVPGVTSSSNSQAVRIWGCSDITIENARVTGGLAVNGVDPSATALDSTGNVLGLPVGKAFNIENSTGVMVSNSDISLFAKGITFATSSDIVIDGNSIHDLRTTPISGSVVSGLTISDNHSWNSNPWNFGGNGDHGDRIHIWTDKTTISGLSITGNTLEQGTGQPMLGIYLDDNGKGLGFDHAVISGNTLVDGEGQGVLLENVSGVVTNNTLIWSGTGSEFNDTPRFDLTAGSHDIVLTDNVGPLSLRDTVHDVTIIRQTGEVVIDSGLSFDALDSIHYDFAVTTGAETVTLADTVHDLKFAGTSDFVGIGNALANHIVGGIGNDTLVGNGGTDILEGRAGNDTYYVDNASQTIIDSSGVDTVQTTVSWTLQTGLENLIYSGTSGATLTGNGSNNHIVGGSGDDILIAAGGRDLLEGGDGNDTYVIDSAVQTVADSSGTDTIVSSISYTLGTGLENLTLTGSAINATGNAADNVLIGNSGNNILDGGTGADIMIGGAGNDTYIVDNGLDRPVEIVNSVDSGGIDTVKTSLVDFTLDTGFENLIFTNGSAHNGYGNAAANTITGGIGADTLWGGAGDDVINGGAGNDIIDGGFGVDILTGSSGNDIFVFQKGQASGDVITDFYGYGAAAGDSIKLVGFGAGTAFTATSTANVWQITDGVDHNVEFITVVGAVHPTDILFG